jgi:hypothetical protein
VGFVSAARWYVEGFSERSGVEVRQESLTNIIATPKALMPKLNFERHPIT